VIRQIGVADGDLLIVLEYMGASQADTIDQRAIGAAQVGEHPIGTLPGYDGVMAGDLGVGQPEIVVLGSTNGQLVLQGNLACSLSIHPDD
jgi:hypothetical protein